MSLLWKCSGLLCAAYLALQLHPGVLGLGLQLSLLVLLDALQEALSALRVLHMLDTHVNSLGQDLAP